MNKQSFELDLQRFESSILSQFESGLNEFKTIMTKQEYRLRSDMHSAIGGFISYMKSKYGNGGSE
jgi:hypothetical protein